MKKLGTGIALALLLLFAQCTLAATGARTAGQALLAPVDGPIGPATSEYVDQAFSRARALGAQLVILELDTPGGLSTAMRHIVGVILNSPIPVVVYVAPSGARAASAGTYITYAAQIAAMAPATNIGAATPVSLGGGGNGDRKQDAKQSQPPASQEAERRKTVNDAVAYIRSLAERRGRNADWAERAVREGVSLTARSAVHQHVVDLIAPDVPALLQAIDGKQVQIHGKTVTLHTKQLHVVHFSPSWRIRLLSVLSDPTLAYILLMVGIIGLVMEGLNPGGTLPGVVGAISLLLAFFAFQLFPVNFTGLIFLALGVVLMIAEALVPSFGALGFGGVVSFLFGSIMLMNTNTPGFQLSNGVIVAVAVCAVLALIGVICLFWRSRRQPVRTGDTAMVGARVEVLGDFSGRGWVLAHGERWQARTDTPLTKGQFGRVVALDGLVLVVEPLREDDESSRPGRRKHTGD